jgi:hypothetical protein
LINNRQNGRRRGRGGGSGAPRPNGSNGGQERGNRIDNRARGNAAQLLEKYKALARDAQMQGDRVNTEYYLQFADHYFRVLSESRSRFEDQQPRQRRDEFAQQSDEEYGDEGERIGNDDSPPAYASQDRGQQQADYGNRSDEDRDSHREAGRDQGGREPRAREQSRDDGRDSGEERRPRRGREPRAERRFESEERAVEPTLALEPPAAPAPAAAAEEEPRAPRRRGRPPKVQPSEEQIEVDRLPPALSLKPSANDGEEPAERPRRTRRPRGESATAEA